MLKNKKGQSTLEYVILVTAVIVVIIALVVGKDSPFKKTLNTTFNQTLNQIGTMSDRLSNSH